MDSTFKILPFISCNILVFVFFLSSFLKFVSFFDFYQHSVPLNKDTYVFGMDII